jgi:hypothetical protein
VPRPAPQIEEKERLHRLESWHEPGISDIPTPKKSKKIPKAERPSNRKSKRKAKAKTKAKATAVKKAKAKAKTKARKAA